MYVTARDGVVRRPRALQRPLFVPGSPGRIDPRLVLALMARPTYRTGSTHTSLCFKRSMRRSGSNFM
jgi:hypothetical protein